MVLATFTTHDTYGGWILFDGAASWTYYDDDSTSTVLNSHITSNDEGRTYMTFDTSSIPANATIYAAELDINYFDKISGGAHAPDSWIHDIHIASDLLDGSLNMTDWLSIFWKKLGSVTPDTGVVTYTLLSKSLSSINKGGNTDFSIRDNSLSSTPGGTWSINVYNCGSGRAGEFRVWYTLPRIFDATLKNCVIKNA